MLPLIILGINILVILVIVLYISAQIRILIKAGHGDQILSYIGLWIGFPILMHLTISNGYLLAISTCLVACHHGYIRSQVSQVQKLEALLLVVLGCELISLVVTQYHLSLILALVTTCLGIYIWVTLQLNLARVFDRGLLFGIVITFLPIFEVALGGSKVEYNDSAESVPDRYALYLAGPFIGLIFIVFTMGLFAGDQRNRIERNEAGSSWENPFKSANIDANEGGAQGFLRSIATSQALFQSGYAVDQNENGSGEYGLLGELTANTKCRGTMEVVKPGYLSKSGMDTTQGVVAKYGYYFQVFLYTKKGAISDKNAFESVSDAEISLQENYFVCVAWPQKYGTTGKKAFAIDSGADVIVHENNGIYDGFSSRPTYNFVKQGKWHSLPTRDEMIRDLGKPSFRQPLARQNQPQPKHQPHRLRQPPKYPTRQPVKKPKKNPSDPEYDLEIQRQELLESRKQENHERAAFILNEIASAQKKFHKGAYMDENKNGIGEFAFLRELMGVDSLPNNKSINLLDRSGWEFSGQGNQAFGYYFDLFHLTSDGFINSRKPQKTVSYFNESEWVACAWPVTKYKTGDYAYIVTQGGEVWADSDLEKYYFPNFTPQAIFEQQKLLDSSLSSLPLDAYEHLIPPFQMEKFPLYNTPLNKMPRGVQNAVRGWWQKYKKYMKAGEFKRARKWITSLKKRIRKDNWRNKNLQQFVLGLEAEFKYLSVVYKEMAKVRRYNNAYTSIVLNNGEKVTGTVQESGMSWTLKTPKGEFKSIEVGEFSIRTLKNFLKDVDQDKVAYGLGILSFYQTGSNDSLFLEDSKIIFKNMYQADFLK